MAKAPPKPLGTGTPWIHMAVYAHKGVKVTCVSVEGSRCWKVGKFLHGSPDHAMDRIEGRLK